MTETRCHMYRRPIPTPSSSTAAAPTPPAPLAPPHVVPEGAEAAQLRFVPNMAQLFRFSALTFNSHRIHYDRRSLPSSAPSTRPHADARVDRYCQESEHRPDCVVHGPMTALLLTTTVASALPPSARLSRLSYRATAPLYVDRPISFTTYRAGIDAAEGEKWPVWATSDLGELAMTGEVEVDRG